MTRLTYYLLLVCVVWPMAALLAPIGAVLAAVDLVQRRRRARVKARAVAQGACSWGQDPPLYVPPPVGDVSPDALRQHPGLAALDHDLDQLATYYPAGRSEP